MLATLEQLADRLGLPPFTPNTPDHRRATANLQDASVLVEEATRRWSEHEPVPDIVSLVALQAAARTYRNPEGAIQRNMGPFGETYGESGVYLTDAERALLSGFQETPSGAIISVPIVREGERRRRGSEYVWIEGSDEPIPYFPDSWC